MGIQQATLHQPYVRAETKMAEVTVKSVILGIVLGVILTAANAYLGLYVGLTVSASIPAAVLSMGILRGVFKKGTILENNIVQTIAASGETLAAGIIFTIPAMLIAGVWTDIQFWPTFIICLTGGLLGICFMIPLRKTHIVDDHTLTYPEGVACAEVLKAGESGGVAAKWVFIALGVGFAVKAFSKITNLFKETVEWAWTGGKTAFFFGFETSPALVGVGYIVGLNVAIVTFLGAATVSYVGVPLVGLQNGVTTDAGTFFWNTWKEVRFLGVGAMVVGGIWSLFNIRRGIVIGIKEAFAGYRQTSSQKAATIRTELNMAPSHILFLLTATTLAILGLYIYMDGSIALATVSTVWVVVSAFFFVAIGSYICGLLGSSNSPISGITICAVLATGGLLTLLGMTGPQGVVATLAVAGVICCAASSAGDISQDLKTGYLLGATPRSQQWMEVLGAIIPALVMGPILLVLHHAYGIANGQPGSLNAPQATLFANLSQGLMGNGTLPWNTILTGAAIGVAIIAIDEVLKARGSKFRFPVMAFAVGMYLPPMLSVTMLIGGVVASVVKEKSDSGAGILFASGLVAGDAILGVVAGGIKYVNKDAIPLALPHAIAETNVASTLCLLALGAALYLIAKGKKVQAA